MRLVYEISLTRKIWNTIGSVEVDAQTFKEGAEVLHDLIHQYYGISEDSGSGTIVSTKTYAKYNLIPTIEIV